MPGGRQRHDDQPGYVSLHDSLSLTPRRRRQPAAAAASRTVGRRYRPAWTDGAGSDFRESNNNNNYSSEDNAVDSLQDVEGRRPTNEADVLSTSTLDRGRSRLNKLMDAVGKPFARKRSKSVDAVLVQRRRGPAAAELSPPASIDDQLSHSPHTSGSTSMVALTQFANGQIPGMVGLRNHGNTCFMNAVIQCLSNTEFFAEYFVTNQFQAAAVAAQKAGRVCAITKQLSRLLSSLWACTYSYQLSAAFRAIVGQTAVQYQGTEQNDAQEFLQWLLDCVNEELYGAGITNSRALYSAKCKVPHNSFCTNMRNLNFRNLSRAGIDWIYILESEQS